MEVEYAKRGVGTDALTTGIIGSVGTALGAMNASGNGGLLGGLFGGCRDGVSHYELTQESALASKDARIALLEANIFNDQKAIELYRYVDGELKDIRSQLCQQAVVNAQITANISCMQQNLAVLNGLTKTVIPIDSICPEPLQRYNSWVAPTTPATGT